MKTFQIIIVSISLNYFAHEIQLKIDDIFSIIESRYVAVELTFPLFHDFFLSSSSSTQFFAVRNSFSIWVMISTLFSFFGRSLWSFLMGLISLVTLDVKIRVLRIDEEQEKTETFSLLHHISLVVISEEAKMWKMCVVRRKFIRDHII